jgi:hypothetical protein
MSRNVVVFNFFLFDMDKAIYDNFIIKMLIMKL